MTVIDQLGLDLGANLGLLLRRAYLLLLPSAYADAAALLGLDVAFDLANPRVQAILDQLAERVAGMTETTRADIRRLIGQAAAEGWSTEHLAQAIEHLGATESRRRARVIARTETAHAYGAAQIAAYQESGVVHGTELLLGPDPCPICQSLVGRVVRLGDAYLPGVTHPPIHPNCTCTIVAVLR